MVDNTLTSYLTGYGFEPRAKGKVGNDGSCYLLPQSFQWRILVNKNALLAYIRSTIYGDITSRISQYRYIQAI